MKNEKTEDELWEKIENSCFGMGEQVLASFVV